MRNLSALMFRRGKPFRLLQLARAGKISLVESEAILDEIGGVLARKFNWAQPDIAEARSLARYDSIEILSDSDFLALERRSD